MSPSSSGRRSTLRQLAREANAAADPLAVLPLLDAARALPGGYADAGKPVPWLTRLWLYQGDKLGQQARVTYRRLLDQTLAAARRSAS